MSTGWSRFRVIHSLWCVNSEIGSACMRIRPRDLALALAVCFWPLAASAVLTARFNDIKFTCLCHVDTPIDVAWWLGVGMVPAILLAFGPRLLRLIAATAWTLMSGGLFVIGATIFVADPIVAGSGAWLAVSSAALVVGGGLAMIAAVRDGRE